MNTEIIAKLQTKNRNFLSTIEGKRQLKQAVEIKKEWKKCLATSNIQVETKYVNPKFLEIYNSKIYKLEIINIGLNNMCHTNAELFCDELISKRIGYNITACPCSKLISFEIHSVNKYNNKLYDFTRDFNDETHKYFLDLDTDITALEFIDIFGKEPVIINKECRCRVDWNLNPIFEKTEKEFIKLIRKIEQL